MKLIGLTVAYQTADLLAQAIESINKTYPDLPIVIIDGSPEGSTCHLFAKELKRLRPKKYLTQSIGENIGHGKGMNFGMNFITLTRQADAVLVFDSDIRLQKPCLFEMADRLDPDVYGVGKVITSDDNGRNAEEGFPYLHPYFCLINAKQYPKYPRFIHHGAPLLKTMKARPKIIDFPVEDYVDHDWRGTRKLQPPEFLIGWEV